MSQQIACSFCGRYKKDVDLMVSGINAHICNYCIQQAQQILDEELKNKEEGEGENGAPDFKLLDRKSVV